QMRVPKIYKFIIKYITPAYLLAILVGWLAQNWKNLLTMDNVAESNQPYVFWTRVGMLLLFLTLAVLVRIAWKERKSGHEIVEEA
ncbi:MAG TPA: hypothetical protein P5511_03750, partial [Candidatus Goldiibacteriota bacterium]|nr:hypothetical protein [Candidatus Goldiibacteriota bacterium]